MIEQAPQHGNFVVAFFFRDLHIQIPCPNALRCPRQPPHRPRQAFGKPQAPPNGRDDQNHSKTKVEQPKVEQNLAAFTFQLLIERGCLLGFVQQSQYLAIHLAGDIKQSVGRIDQPHQSAQFRVGPVLNKHHLTRFGAHDLGGGGFFKVEKIAFITPDFQNTGGCDDVNLFQSALDRGLPRHQNRPHRAIIGQGVLFLRAV